MKYRYEGFIIVHNAECRKYGLYIFAGNPTKNVGVVPAADAN